MALVDDIDKVNVKLVVTAEASVYLTSIENDKPYP